MDRYDEVRRDAKRARADAQAAVVVAARRAEEIASLLTELGMRDAPDRGHMSEVDRHVTDPFVALQSARDQERRGRERAARAHDRAARQHDRLADVYERQDDLAGCVRERAVGVRERHAAAQDRRAAKRDS
jgi:hypothetical protein